MKHYYYLLMFVFLSQTAFSQNRYWILAPDFYDNQLNVFSPLPTDPSGYQGQSATGAQNIITDQEGEIVFFIVDENIYDRKGKLIDVMHGTEGLPMIGEMSETLILPDLVDCNLYHIISTTKRVGGNIAKGQYCRLNVSYTSEGELNLNSGIIPNLPLTDPEVDQLAICNSGFQDFESIVGYDWSSNETFNVNKPLFGAIPNEKTYTLVGMNDRSLFFFTISTEGISYINNFNIREEIYPETILFADEIRRSELETIRLANGNIRIGLPVNMRFPGLDPEYNVLVLDFDPTLQYVLNSNKNCRYEFFQFLTEESIDSKIPGLEFSPLGNKIFIAHAPYGTTDATLDYWDLTGATPQKTEMSSDPEYAFAQIETSTTGNLMLPKSNYLSSISTPDGTPILNATQFTIPFYPVSNATGNNSSVRLLQDQVDGMDYSNFDPLIYDALEYEATGTATWKPNTIDESYNNNPLIYGFGSITYIKKELRIKAGSNIRIENMTLKFAPGARLIIENGENGQQGGKLTLLNTVLINDERCDKDSLWLGVEVWGNQNAAQGSVFNTTQGVLRMFGTSRIENAYIGALIGKRTVDVLNTIEIFDPYCAEQIGEIDIEEIIPNSYENARSGGIIQANAGAVFHNNPMGVWFKTYSAPGLANNLSFFKATEFSWENVLLENKTPNTHINLESVKGIKVNGCSFLLDDPSLYSEIGQGFGIRARESQFYVDNFCPQLTQVGQTCPNPTPSFFQNLSYGVYATNANALTYEVQNSEFENCRYGIYTTGMEDERITKNKFAVRELVNQQTAGIVLSNSTGYTVQENTFSEHDNEDVANGDGNSYGVVIHNSGEASNLVYKNYFSDLKIGGMSQKINGVDDETVPNSSKIGLQWKCNSFKSAIYEADLGVNGIIDYQQGYLVAGNLQEAKAKTASNRFSMNGESTSLFPDHDIKVHPSSPDFQYIYIDANSHRPDNYTASNVTALPAQFNAANVTSTGNICPSLLTRKVIELKQEFADRENDLKLISEKEEYGSSATLLALIDENSEAQSTFQTLLNNSPYLSDEVLSAYIQSTPPSGFLKEVLIANSKLSASILDEVMNSSLPNGSKNQVLAAQNGFSSKESAQQSLHYLKSERSDLFNQISSKLLLDTNELATTQAYEEFLKEVGDKEALRRLLDLYIDKGVQPNDTLRTQINSVVCANYIDLSLIKEDLKTSTSVCDGLMDNQELVDRLDYIVYDANECVAAKALCLLDFVETAVAVPTFLPLDGPSMIMIPSENSTSSQEYQALEVKVSMYPNPSTGQVYFDLPDFEEGTLQIQLFDVTGKEVYSVNYFNTNGELVDFTSLKKGTYIVRITLGNDYNESHLLQLND